MKPVRSYIALGTNLGSRLLNLAEARRRLAQLGALQTGPVIETPALLPETDSSPQPPYLNSVDALETTLSVYELFVALKHIERLMGRQVSTRWAPRIIDLDLLLFGEQQFESGELTVPHPRMHLRRFVLEPLAILAPGAWHPAGTALELLGLLNEG